MSGLFLTSPLSASQSRLRLWVRLLTSALVMVVLLSQSLGQLHAIKHGGLDNTSLATAGHVAHESHDDGSFLEQLFSSHSSSTDCRLYDQLRDSHALPSLALMLFPIVLPSLLVAIFAGEALARWAALFEARGPPLTF